MIFDGQLIAASQSAYIQAGTIMAPLDPFILRVATSVESDGQRRITIQRGAHAVTLVQGEPIARVDGTLKPLPIAPYVRDGRLIIPLAAIARSLDVRVRYEPAVHAAYLFSERAGPLATMTPFVAPPVLALPVPTFTADPIVTPRPVFTGIPRARRTPIEVYRAPL